MYSKLEVETKTTTSVLYNGKPIYEVLKTIADEAHDAFLYISDFKSKHEDFEFENNIEGIEGCLCKILDTIGD